MKELQPAQHPELLLAIDARVLLAQPLVHAGELGGEVEAALVALGGFLLQRHGDDVLQLLRNVFGIAETDPAPANRSPQRRRAGPTMPPNTTAPASRIRFVRSTGRVEGRSRVATGATPSAAPR